MEGVCLIFDATYSCLVWLWEIEQKKYPYYIAVGYGVGQAPRLLCEWVLFMYDSFFFLHFLFIMPALFVRCSERRSDGYWVVLATVKQANAYP